MRLNVDLDRLEAAARQMRGDRPPVVLEIDVRRGLDPVDPIDIELDPIDIELKRGIKIDDPASIRSDPGLHLLSYKKRPVVLYIQDHRWRLSKAMEEGAKGNKVHVVDCHTLEEMRHKGLHERYVATNNVSGNFYVTGEDDAGNRRDGHAQLMPCQNCLSRLNYQGFGRNPHKVLREFQWSKFFDEYSPHFARMPTRRAGEFDGGYTADWDVISDRYRRSRNFICENCRVDLKEDRDLLDVHHVNGVKTDNRRVNLRALCVDCHRKQPGHEHMRVDNEDIKRVRALRRRQGL